MKNSKPIWAALRNAGFRRLWMAAMISGTCVAAQDNAATWTMNTFAGSSLWLSAMSTASAVPFFLFTLPAGALADRVDRRKLICAINLYLAAAAAALALLGWVDLLNPCLILIWLFFVGVGFAVHGPSWTSIVRQTVSDAELPSAAILGSLQFSIAGILGPLLGGLLVAVAGASFVFALGAAGFLLIVVTARQCKQRPPGEVVRESLLQSFRAMVQHVRHAPGLQSVFIRSFLFGFFISVVPALIPVIGLKLMHLSSTNLGLLFTSVGIGSVFGATVVVPRLRTRWSPDGLVLAANLLLVLVYISMALISQAGALFGVAALAGLGWAASASELWLAAQLIIPDGARGRMNAALIVISQGAMALGAVVWGSTSAFMGATFALSGAAILLLASTLLTHRLSIDFAGSLNDKFLRPGVCSRKAGQARRHDLEEKLNPAPAIRQ